MNVRVDQIVANLREFYSTPDDKRRSQLNEWLSDVQKSDEAWNVCWRLIESSPSSANGLPLEPFVQLFGVNCLYQKLINAKFFDHLMTSSLTEIERLGHVLIQMCETNDHVPLLREKFCLSLAVYVLKTMPDVFEDPFKVLKRKWSETHPSLLLEVFRLLVGEFRRLAQPLERRNLIRSVLRQKEAFVANCAVEILQLPKVDDALTESAIKCIEAWISFDCSNLSDWQAIVVLCLNKIQDSPYVVTCVSKFFQSFVENTELNRMEKFIEQLYEYAANLTNFARTFDKDDEAYEDIARMIISLGTNQTKTLLRLIVEKSASAESIVQFVMELSATPGYYPVDETISILPVNFWYHLHEDATIVNDKAVMDQNLVHVKPIFRRLLPILPAKLRYHREFFTQNWTAEDKEKFKYYRTELSDTLSCCYRVLYGEMTEYLLDYLKSYSAPAPNNNAQIDYGQIESILYVYECIGDYITHKNQSAMLFLNEFFPRLCIQVANDRSADILINTGLRLVSKYNHVIAESGLIITYLPIIAGFLRNSEYVNNGTVALLDLCSWKDSAFEWNTVAESTVFAATECFNTAELDQRDRLRALSCAGTILSTQRSDIILQYLNVILAPRLNRLKNSVSASDGTGITADTGTVASTSSFADKNELMFEFDVISTLIGALKSKSTNGSSSSESSTMTSSLSSLQSENVNPVLLVITQSVELFRSIYVASGGDPEIAKKLCESLRSSLAALYAEAAPLLPSFCQLLTLIYPPHSCALQVASTLLLIFGDDQSQWAVTVSLFNALLRITAAPPTVDDVDALGEFLNICSTLAKKNSRFFDVQRGADSATTTELACKCLTVDDTYVAKQAAMFLQNYFRSESDSARSNVEKFGPIAVRLCFQRIKTDLLTSLVNHVTDVIYYMCAKYPEFLGVWRSQLPVDHPLVMAMFKEVGNKMKFREFARQINVGCRQNMISL